MLAGVRPGVPVETPARGAVEGLRHLGVPRVAILTPHLAETTAPVVALFRRRRAGGRARPRPRSCRRPRDRPRCPRCHPVPARAADDPRAEALFVSGTALPVLTLIPELEATLGKPVASFNQALGWAMLRAAGLRGSGPGRPMAAETAPA